MAARIDMVSQMDRFSEENVNEGRLRGRDRGARRGQAVRHVQALSAATVVVHPGEIVALCGDNGAGSRRS